MKSNIEDFINYYSDKYNHKLENETDDFFNIQQTMEEEKIFVSDIKLYPHQISCINNMIFKTLYKKLPIDTYEKYLLKQDNMHYNKKNQTFTDEIKPHLRLLNNISIKKSENNFGILSSEIGSGKTIMSIIFSYFITNILKRDEFKEIKTYGEKYSSYYYNSDGNIKIIDNYLQENYKNENLIDIRNIIIDYLQPYVNNNKNNLYFTKPIFVVPHYLINQWHDEIKKHTSLSVHKISSIRDEMDDLEYLNNNFDIILLNINKYTTFFSRKNNKNFSLIMYDEMDIIGEKIKNINFTSIKSEFNWFITTTFERMINENCNISLKGCFINLFYEKHYYEWCRNYNNYSDYLCRYNIMIENELDFSSYNKNIEYNYVIKPVIENINILNKNDFNVSKNIIDNENFIILESFNIFKYDMLNTNNNNLIKLLIADSPFLFTYELFNTIITLHNKHKNIYKIGNINSIFYYHYINIFLANDLDHNNEEFNSDYFYGYKINKNVSKKFDDKYANRHDVLENDDYEKIFIPKMHNIFNKINKINPEKIEKYITLKQIDKDFFLKQFCDVNVESTIFSEIYMNDYYNIEIDTEKKYKASTMLEKNVKLIISLLKILLELENKNLKKRMNIELNRNNKKEAEIFISEIKNNEKKIILLNEDLENHVDNKLLFFDKKLITEINKTNITKTIKSNITKTKINKCNDYIYFYSLFSYLFSEKFNPIKKFTINFKYAKKITLFETFYNSKMLSIINYLILPQSFYNREKDTIINYNITSIEDLGKKYNYIYYLYAEHNFFKCHVEKNHWIKKYFNASLGHNSKYNNKKNIIFDTNKKLIIFKQEIKNIYDNENNKILIFIDNSTDEETIINILNDKKIKHNIIKGNNNVIKSSIKKYNNGIIRTIILNSSYYGSGLDLSSTTHIIILNKLDDATHRQVVGRAKRIGKKSCKDLTVYYIYDQVENVEFK